MNESTNKAAFRRFADAVNSGDMELVSETIDQLVEPDALIRTPLPSAATGAALLKEVFTRLHRAFPDLHLTIEDLVARERRSSPGIRSPGRTRATTWGWHRPENSSATPRYSSAVLRTAKSRRPGASSTFSRNFDSWAPFPEAPHNRPDARRERGFSPVDGRVMKVPVDRVSRMKGCTNASVRRLGVAFFRRTCRRGS